MPADSTFHHAGYVVPSIRDAAAAYQRLLGIEWDGEIVHDRLQMVRVAFLPANRAGVIELVEPAGPRSPVRQFAEAGGGLHHVCYEVSSLADRIAEAQVQGCTLVRVPLAAAAFGGRKIAWLRTPDNQLIEFLQR